MTAGLIINFIDQSKPMKFSFALVSVFALSFQSLSISAVSAQTASLSWMDNLIPSFRFANVEELAHLTNLTSLNLAMNKVVDVKPLASLNKLTTLDLYSNQIKDVTSLASLNKLTTLDLSRNAIEPKVCPLNSASICKFGSI